MPNPETEPITKKYRLSPADAEELLSFACRYRKLQTEIDEGGDSMTVWTNFIDNPEPTSIAATYDLIIVD